MRLSFLATACSLLSFGLAGHNDAAAEAVAAATTTPTASPAAAIAAVSRRQISRAELAARANHPDLFRRDDPAPVVSGTTSTPDICQAVQTSTTTTTTTTSTGVPTITLTPTRRRRSPSADLELEEMEKRKTERVERRVRLTPEDMASFLIGHGTFAL